jgi:uncharacterized protein (TIGR03435 family)
MTPVTQAIGAALIDFLWQGVLVGAIFWLALLCLRHRPAAERYIASCLALLALSLLPVLTVAALLTSVASLNAVHVSSASAPAPVAVPQTLLQIWMVPEAPRQPWLDLIEQWALPLWTVGVALLSLRLLGAWIHVRTITRTASAADRAAATTVESIRNRLGITRPVRVAVSSRVEGPGVIGWLRPIVLLPPAAAMGLTSQQIEAVLAHEIAHIKRHDYAVNMLQILVEALFFYHPVVWWISRCIRIEREVCCDEIAVRTAGDAVGYARALTELAKRQLTPRLSMAAARGPLLYRIQHLVGHSYAGLAPAMLPGLAAIGVAAIGVAALAVVLNVGVHAQDGGSAANQPRFDVTSVKVNHSNDGIIFDTLAHGRVTLTGYSLRALIQHAYQVQEFQIIGGPDWIDRERFDVSATSPDDPSLDRRSDGPSARTLMMRSLLADRFGLAVHKDTRERPVFAIVPSRRGGSFGPRLRPTSVDCAVATGEDACGTTVAPGFVRGRGITLAQLATALSKLTNTGSSLNRLVVDRSGIDGRFNLDLQFTPDRIPNWSPALADSLGVPPVDPQGASIFTSVQEQLGLKLEPQNAPVDVLVIDRVSRPTEN